MKNYHILPWGANSKRGSSGIVSKKVPFDKRSQGVKRVRNAEFGLRNEISEQSLVNSEQQEFRSQSAEGGSF